MNNLTCNQHKTDSIIDKKESYQNRISIIIPARSVDFLLQECITEIRKLYSFVKIIVILDEIDEQKIQVFDHNILVLKSLNLNMSAKRNQAVDIAETEYLAFIDSDAYPCNNWIENAIDFLDKNSNYSVVTGNQILPPDDNFEKQCLRFVRFCRLFTYPKWCKVIDINASEQDVKEFMTSNLIIKKSVYQSSGAMDESMYLAEDNEFSDRLTNLGYKIRFIPNVRVFHHETTLVPFLNKVFSQSFNYSKDFIIKKGKFKLKEYLIIFAPLIYVLVALVCLLSGIIFDFEEFLYILLFCASIVISLFIFYGIRLAIKMKSQHFKAFLYFLYVFVLFCIVYLIGTFLGLLKISSIDIRKHYKHY